MRDIPVFPDEDDCTHPIGDDPSFQESNLFVWHDLSAGVGGFWRIGQEAVVEKINSCFGVFTHDGLRFRSNVDGGPLGPNDRSDTHMSCGESLRVDLDRLAMTANFPDCEAQLSFEDFHPRYDYFNITNRPGSKGGLGHHFEVGGRMSGKIRLGERELEIDALAYRDRSWGPRPWGLMRGTRWWPAVFGPDLIVHVSASILEGYPHGSYGYMIRDGVPYAMTESDVAVTLDYDAIGPRAGSAPFTLDNGERGELSHERTDAIVMHVHGFTAVESIGIARLGDRVGMSLLEVSTNPAGGTKPPVVVLAANNSDGFSRRE